MKKELIWAIVCLLFAACTNDEEPFESVKATKDESNSNKRTLTEAIKIAEKAIGILNEVDTRCSKRKVSLTDTKYITSRAITRNGKLDTLMYILNYEENQGFAIVSASKATEELIAVSNQGSYSENALKENQGLNIYMGLAEKYITTAGLITDPNIDDSPIPLTEHKMESVKDTTFYGPYLRVSWGQGEPYNGECPIISGVQCPTGCVTTAVAQIMSYYEYPTSITIDYNSDNIHNSPILWGAFKAHASNKDETFCNNILMNHANLAEFFRQIGHKVKTEYTPTVSLSSIYYAKDFLKSVGYSVNSPTEFSQSAVNSEIQAKRIMYIKGSDKDNSGNVLEAHAWVLDGVMRITNTAKEYTRAKGELEWTLIGTSTSQTYYNHFNWGYDGDSNGYYSSNVFDMDKYQILDDEVTDYFSKKYQYDVYLLTNITHK